MLGKIHIHSFALGYPISNDLRSLVENNLIIYARVYFQALCSNPFVYMYLHQHHTILIIFAVSLYLCSKFWNLTTTLKSSNFDLFQNCFVFLGSLKLHMNFRWTFLFLKKMSLKFWLGFHWLHRSFWLMLTS